jgi:isoleucyl-tRNA synthetase
MDFKNSYRTVDTNYMESVWWVFASMFKKQLIYEGLKVMPYSIGCKTPLSNFEAGENYQECKDIGAIVKFHLLDGRMILIYTTTAWTLPSNMMICVNPNIDYVEMDNKCILAKSRITSVFPKEKITIVREFKGEELAGLKYRPCFSFATTDTSHSNVYSITCDSFVKDDEGTGAVHLAPSFGEDDFRVCSNNGIPSSQFLCCCDDDGKFNEQFPPHFGHVVKTTDRLICEMLGNDVVSAKVITHSYPFCWRSNTPLIYKAVSSWFVDVPKLRPQLLQHNARIHWVPKSIGERRFHNWLENAKEWSISRSRFWGTPIPIWRSQDGEEIIVVDSIEKLKNLSGIENIPDLHREYIDDITFVSPASGKLMTRIPDVFDCWFESGSMPYAHLHYPFENKELFESSFPADFIAEGLDQTRGWFYTLLVISTALFDRPAYYNVVVNGLVLSAEGEKLSKSKKNYESPETVLNQYGADALRLYLVNSPASHADPLKFNVEGIQEMVRDVIVVMHNMYQLSVYSENMETVEQIHPFVETWMNQMFNHTISFINEEMKAYRLYNVVTHIIQLLDKMSRWYINQNKEAIKMNPKPLKEKLILLSRMMSPFTPFMSEYIYQKLTHGETWQGSVHFLEYPNGVDETKETTIRQMEVVQSAIEMARQIRNLSQIRSNRFQMKEMQIYSENPADLEILIEMREYIRVQSNVECIVVNHQYNSLVKKIAIPKQSEFGKRSKHNRREVLNFIEGMTEDMINECLYHGEYIMVLKDSTEFVILPTDFTVSHNLKEDSGSIKRKFNGFLVEVDTAVSEYAQSIGIVREFISIFQQYKRENGIKPGQFENIQVYTACEKLKPMLDLHYSMVYEKLGNLRLVDVSLKKYETTTNGKSVISRFLNMNIYNFGNDAQDMYEIEFIML